MTNKDNLNDFDADTLIEPKKTFFSCVTSMFSYMFSSKKIGELNGKWAFLLKVTMILCVLSVPTFFTWATWVTNEVFASQYHRNATNTYEHRLATIESNINLIGRIEQDISKIANKVDTLPPPDWRRRIELLESQHKILEEETATSDKKNSEEHSQILILLESIKTKVDLMSSK